MKKDNTSKKFKTSDDQAYIKNQYDNNQLSAWTKTHHSLNKS